MVSIPMSVMKSDEKPTIQLGNLGLPSIMSQLNPNIPKGVGFSR